MKKLKDVIGSKEASKELIIGKDTMYIHTNIKPYVDKNEIDKENKSELYIYDEIQFTLHEYLELKQQEIDLMTKAQNSTEDLLQEIILKMYEV
ncbi:hypothetical protein [Anaerococcus hydrogenalis]|jgi:hypothetical protein|uniref:hypothetical protein n=1 Tax=Anaerococcus hydrogenalis TaxID=33029 RepID=UPI002904E73F|nr:hypothetical protein [Anaerococcus hydrogenalis]MDU1316659.1 hypothetical protein [Anaerococcus hydrogenalis]